MNEQNGKKWTREETILAFDLYCRTPFGKIHQHNPDIIQLAKLLGRTPGSVGLKMANLSSLDPEIQKHGLSGMRNCSKLDGEIFAEFSADWSGLSYQAQEIRAKLEGKSIESIIGNEDLGSIPAGEYKDRIVKTRVGQSFFRKTVLSSYDNRCCITQISNSALLVASHIKPWKDSDEKTERTNPSNGLCLNSLHDRAFDAGLITISTDYKIVVSSRLKTCDMDIDTKQWFFHYEGMEIILPKRFKPDRDFLQYHNDVVFQH